MLQKGLRALTGDDLLYSLCKIGLFAAVGGLVDFLMSGKEKKQLRGWLEEWWYKFDDVTWPSLGAREAAEAIRLLDAVVGSRLNSGKRWVASAAIVLGCELIYRGDVFVGLAPKIIDSQPTELVILVVLVALSFSLTRVLSLWASKASIRHGGWTFFVLLLIHLLLFALWRPISHNFAIVPAAAVILYDWGYSLRDGFHVLFFERDYTLAIRNELAVRWSTESMCDLVTYGTRIVFSLVFAGSFLMRPVARSLISRVWARIVESDRPLFTLMLGASSSLVITIVEAIRLVK